MKDTDKQILVKIGTDVLDRLDLEICKPEEMNSYLRGAERALILAGASSVVTETLYTWSTSDLSDKECIDDIRFAVKHMESGWADEVKK